MKSVHPEDLLARVSAYHLALACLALAGTETEYPGPTRDAITVLHEDLDRTMRKARRAIKTKAVKPGPRSDVKGQILQLVKS
ncbi:MAG: hypothetical protein AB7G75_24665 [Candidatus Binatia bacterium]